MCRRGQAMAYAPVTAPVCAGAALLKLCCPHNQLCASVCLVNCSHAQGACSRTYVMMTASEESSSQSFPSVYSDGVMLLIVQGVLLRRGSACSTSLSGAIPESASSACSASQAELCLGYCCKEDSVLPVTSLDTPRHCSAASRWCCAPTMRPTSSACTAASMCPHACSCRCWPRSCWGNFCPS